MSDKDFLEPIAPGEILREDFLEPLDISINQLSRDLAVPPNRAVSSIVGPANQSRRPGVIGRPGPFGHSAAHGSLPDPLKMNMR